MVDPADTLAWRLRQARLQTAARRGETISQGRMAELISAEIGQPLWQAQWSSYELGKAEPPLKVISAAAKLSGLDESYIAFRKPNGTRPLLNLDPSRDHQLTAEEAGRAEAQLSEKARAKPEVPSRKAVGKKRRP